MANLTILPDAEQYIQKNGGAVTVRLISGRGGCCPMLSPLVMLGAPADQGQFKTMQRDNITVYLQKDISALSSGVTVELNKLLWLKKLSISGLDILP